MQSQYRAMHIVHRAVKTHNAYTIRHAMQRSLDLFDSLDPVTILADHDFDHDLVQISTLSSH